MSVAREMVRVHSSATGRGDNVSADIDIAYLPHLSRLPLNTCCEGAKIACMIVQ